MALSDPMVVGTKIAFIYFNLRDAQGNFLKEREVSAMLMSGSHFQKTDAYLLGQYQDASLVYLPQDQEIVIR